ncbi:RHS repeat domain-containing protein, partial [Flavihumibacter sp.]|uniref:RHS repeat domain-containing protein n=1 Tax=Flavihumibacter sp. TaxID=1913981 RepID=UPI002FC65E14
NAKAYLSWMLFDEQFNYVSADVDPVGAGNKEVHDKFFTTSPVNITKRGYLYIHVSNESNLSVFFDNLAVTHTPGPLVEETHYYPFGLTMAGISSKAAGRISNKKKFNDGSDLQSAEFSDGSGLEWYDVKARYYDPQLGRFMQIDPEPDEEDQEGWVPYQYGLDNPISNNDPDGKFWNNVVGGLVGGLVEVGTQLITEGKVTSWGAVGVATVEGALTSGGSVVRRAVVSGGAALVKSGLDYTEKNGSIKNAKDAVNVAKNAVVDKVVDKVSRRLAKGVTGKVLQKPLATASNKVMVSKNQVVKNLNSSFTGKQKQAIAKTIVNGQKEISKNIRESPQKVFDITTKGLTNQKVDEVKRNTNLQ